ncbi:hypothetical protein GDO81_023112 [Engystomops pustulosus]|uniref:Uncharacterized protein n=1 Tax=Engystomops pustulosus TaxID=76066 RepID=A0AAV6Z4S4_ENGPU|nr:hypothetical protein GDO81_023112 [Engystomops pustulosus]
MTHKSSSNACDHACALNRALHRLSAYLVTVATEPIECCAGASTCNFVRGNGVSGLFSRRINLQVLSKVISADNFSRQDRHFNYYLDFVYHI